MGYINKLIKYITNKDYRFLVNSLMWEYRKMPDREYIERRYHAKLGKVPDLDNPKTFNEKLQWLKLNYYPQNPKVIQGADKYAVREYIQEKGLEHLLTHLYGVWDDAEQIDWEKLPNQFVLKCTHGCAYNIVCKNKSTLDQKSAEKQLNKWLKEDFGAFNVEIHYSMNRHHRIICEEYLGESITDYKFFCFHGIPVFYYVSEGLIDNGQARIGFFDINGEKLPMKRREYKDLCFADKPAFFDSMKESAKKLSKDFPFVRVDFFVTNDRYYFAELTFTPGGCMMAFDPESFDLEWGKLIDLTGLMSERK